MVASTCLGTAASMMSKRFSNGSATRLARRSGQHDFPRPQSSKPIRPNRSAVLAYVLKHISTVPNPITYKALFQSTSDASQGRVRKTLYRNRRTADQMSDRPSLIEPSGALSKPGTFALSSSRGNRTILPGPDCRRQVPLTLMVTLRPAPSRRTWSGPSPDRRAS